MGGTCTPKFLSHVRRDFVSLQHLTRVRCGSDMQSFQKLNIVCFWAINYLLHFFLFPGLIVHLISLLLQKTTVRLVA